MATFESASAQGAWAVGSMRPKFYNHCSETISSRGPAGDDELAMSNWQLRDLNILVRNSKYLRNSSHICYPYFELGRLGALCRAHVLPSLRLK